jgi:hypothetical protein
VHWASQIRTPTVNFFLHIAIAVDLKPPTLFF